MGNYLDKALLITKLGEKELLARTDKDRSGAIDDDTLNEYIEASEGVIDGYLRSGGYTAPLTAPVDPLIIRLSLDVLRFDLYRGGQIPPEVQTRYDNAISRLKDIAAGRLDVAVAGATESPGGSIAYSAPEKVFTDANLDGF